MEPLNPPHHPLDAAHGDAAGWSLPRDILLPGVITGLFGALFMLALALPMGAFLHGDVWYAMRLVGGVFFREAPVGPWAVVLGLAVHLTTASGLAILFALLLPPGGTAMEALMLGLLMGLMLQAVIPPLIVPFASPPLAREAPDSALFLLHLAFGASLTVIVPLRRLPVVQKANPTPTR
ncbi:hypothetical protein [Myxococcus landrumensis]|uniref:HPP family protein n=1 Tax=Myxococcus landrumensis TaxID=2813577 RepID=A0ABX7NN02_9BACT|nr:hypothetical protein [Myxococcus landrumus]QSQ17618.1 hypothetical protein JY572_16925 [Myxococcus landrumus]